MLILLLIIQLYLARVLVESMFKGPLKKNFKKEQDIENFKAFHLNSYIYPTMMVFSGEIRDTAPPNGCTSVIITNCWGS